MKLRKILLFTTLSMAAAGASGNACLPIPKPVPNSCSNDFDLAFPFGDETSLISSIESGNLWTAIKYRFKTSVPDSLVLVSWKDKNGAVLFSGSNSSLLGYRGAVDVFQWGETRRGLFPSANTSIEKGTADFTGSEGLRHDLSGSRDADTLHPRIGGAPATPGILSKGTAVQIDEHI